MFGTLLRAGITRIAAHIVIDLGNVRDIGRRANHAVYQPRPCIDANVRLHTEIVLITFEVTASPTAGGCTCQSGVSKLTPTTLLASPDIARRGKGSGLQQTGGAH
jgi:hypothetical protein